MTDNTIANIGTDVAGQMLDALMKNPQDVSPSPADSVPTDDKKKFLIANAKLLTVPERKEIGDVLVANNRRNAICGCLEGCVINLDSLPESIISNMYELMVYKLNKHK